MGNQWGVVHVRESRVRAILEALGTCCYEHPIEEMPAFLESVDWLPVSSTRTYLPRRVGLPDAIVLGRDELLVEVDGNLPQRQPTGPVLSHHSDRGLLGAVFHELAIQAVEAKRELAGVRAPVPVLRDAESVQGFKDP